MTTTTNEDCITTNTYTVTSSLPSNSTWATGLSGASIKPASHVQPINEDDLKHEAMQAPLSALVDMWQVRFGGTWAKEDEINSDQFWRIALIRLMGVNKLERHNIASSYSHVYRIIE